VRQTSLSQAAEIVRESYFVLVPRSIAAGEYEVRLSVYDASAGASAARAQAGNLLPVGRVLVR
jgi:hypothetical protein